MARFDKSIDGTTTGSRFFFYWLPVIGYCAAIFLQSSFPSPESLPAIPGSDKLMHAAAWAILGGLFFRAYRTTNRGRDLRHAMWISILFAACYGCLDEVHQYFVPERNADWLDAAADTVGGIAGVLLYSRLITRHSAGSGLPPLR